MTRRLTEADVIALLRIFEQSGWARLDLTCDALRVSADRMAPGAHVPDVADGPERTSNVASPLLGVFVATGAKGQAPVRPGARVEDDTVVGAIRVLDEASEVRARLCGTVTEVLVEDGAFVEYGQPLLRVRSDAATAQHNPIDQARSP